MSDMRWQDWADQSGRTLRAALEVLTEARVAAAAEAMAAALAADRDRRPYRVMSLVGDPAFLTAWSNDASFEDVFARQVQAYGAEGGLLVGFTTSGRSGNVLAAFAAAKARGMATVALTGQGGTALEGQVDHLLAVPATDTALVQQIHLMLYHHWCRVLEARLG
jgi:D-sedoheptulose 7-phosphate isomerase